MLVPLILLKVWQGGSAEAVDGVLRKAQSERSLFVSFVVSADFIKHPRQSRDLSQLLPSFLAKCVDYASGIVAMTAGWSP